jgi:hypothetical protein
MGEGLADFGIGARTKRGFIGAQHERNRQTVIGSAEAIGRPRGAARQRLFLAVANLRPHAALFTPLLPPTLT